VLLDWDPNYLFRKLIADDDERRWFLTEICSPSWNAKQDGGRSWAEATSELARQFPEHSNLIAAYDEKWEVAKDRWGFLNGFDGTVVSGTEKVTKPDLRIYQILLDRYALDPARTFYTDDMKENVEAARVAGLDAEVFVDPDTLRQQLVDRGVLPAAA
jgi:2-haloacid dehalogenase